MKLTIAGKAVDYNQCFPIRLGLWRDLEAIGVTDESGNLIAGGAKATCGLVEVFTKHAAGVEFQTGMCDEIAVKDAERLVLWIGERLKEENQAENPTDAPASSSAPSTISPLPTAGGRAT